MIIMLEGSGLGPQPHALSENINFSLDIIDPIQTLCKHLDSSVEISLTNRGEGGILSSQPYPSQTLYRI